MQNYLQFLISYKWRNMGRRLELIDYKLIALVQRHIIPNGIA